MTSVSATNFMIKSLDLAVPMFVCVSFEIVESQLFQSLVSDLYGQ